MSKRKKRLEKGVESITKLIKVHEEKLKDAKIKGLVELASYYARDIARLEKQKGQKEEKIEE
ncbi:hypothetical protein COS75_00850 [Candidatus Pacearchaeota archaeon CG06_land_8_20_14_3_00_35_12]|nr:MAG: hypothetical protein COS75_00850 [Candidatus Pacearchaeota archaeon CG06_land_8_20_14_3_00_35_12]